MGGRDVSPQSSVTDPDPSDPYVYGPLESGSDPLVRSTGMDPDPSIIKQK